MGLHRKIRCDIERVQAIALAHPLSAERSVAPAYLRHSWTSGERVALAIVSIERCGCLGETPLWHSSVSIWSKSTHRRIDDEHLAFVLAETLLDGVGVPDTLWWWNPDKYVGHLRSHLSPSDSPEQVPPSMPGPADHDEPGLWYVRRVALDQPV